MSRLSLGGMRFTSKESAFEVIRLAAVKGIKYIDTCPCYCYISDYENSET